MARPPYTTLLWRGTNTAAGTTAGPSVPAGVEWVIRNVDLLTPGEAFEGVGPWYLQNTSSQFLLGWGTRSLAGAATYSWEGRQWIGPGDTLFAATARAGFQWAVTGFQFTLL